MIMESTNTIQTASHSVTVDVTKNVENAEKYGKDGMFSTKAQVGAVANQATRIPKDLCSLVIILEKTLIDEAIDRKQSKRQTNYEDMVSKFGEALVADKERREQYKQEHEVSAETESQVSKSD